MWDLVRAVYLYVIIPGGAKKRPEHSHGVMQQSSRNESAEKHVCNEQTSSNTSRNSRIKHFRISRDTNEIVLHVIKQCLQAVHPRAAEPYVPVMPWHY